MEKRALGKGLSALISSQRKVDEVLKKEVPLDGKASARKDVLFVATSRLAPNRFQPRVDFDMHQLEELIASIKEKGVLQPILVRHAGGKFEIIAGERRFKAAKHLKLEEVPVVIRDVDDREALILSVVENIQRQELNPMEEAHAFERLIHEFGLTQEGVAQAVSKDRTTVSNILRLLKLPQEVQRAISSGKISFGHGRALVGLDNVREQIRLTQLVLSNSLSVRELENLISSKKPISAKRKKAAKSKDPYVQDLENQLQRALGTKVKILAHKKRGKIQIEYYSQEDFERLLKRLTRN